MGMPSSVIDAFIAQAEGSDRIGSPFVANLCRLLAARLDHTTRFGHKILDWPGDPREDALALRACGALHAIARSWKEPELRAAYPPAPFNPDHLWHLIADVLTRHDNYLAAFLDSPPQTNEVARSALILGAALHVAARTRLPLALYEIGASAGLNLGFDGYRYDLGNGRGWGEADAPLVVHSDWRGALPPRSAGIRVVSRQGCDRNPLDPASEGDAERLMAYIWADQPHRLKRTEAALRFAAQKGRKVERADGADWVEREFAAPAAPGVCRFFFHTIVWQYLPAATRIRIEAALAGAAAAATDDAPLARFSLEPDGTVDADTGALMTLTLWPAGETIVLGRGDYHGRWANWAEL
jgi:hypothetical protein